MNAVCIHSKYNPRKEAEQFVQRIIGNPLIIIITEPGDSYLAEPLRLYFPLASLIAIRYSDTYFLDSDVLWDFVWRPAFGSLPSFLHNHVPDELLAATQFLAWKPADKAFPHKADVVWKDIRYAIDMIKSIMYTRSFFGNRWLKNTVKNFIYLHHCYTITFGSKPFLLTGAGPSLNEVCLNSLKNVSIVSVSSALAALMYKDSVIDLCISTDAGYWALRHFDGIQAAVPVAFPLEAAIPSRVLTQNPCIPFSYNSPLEQALFCAAGWKVLSAKENGTVMGTALDLLLDNTDSTICIAGLDLAATKGFSHVQPHSSTCFASQTIDKLQPLAGKLAVQNFNTQSLSVYRNWFLQLPVHKKKRIYYLGNTLLAATNSIQSPLEQSYSAAECQKTVHLHTQPVLSCADRKNIVRMVFTETKNNICNALLYARMDAVSEEFSLEKQVCALCAYTDYCTYIKNQKDTVVRDRLLKKVSNMLDFLLQRYS